MIGKYIVRIQWTNQIEQERLEEPGHISIYDYLKLNSVYCRRIYCHTEWLDEAATFDSVDEAKNAIKDFVSYGSNMYKYIGKMILLDIVLVKEEVVDNIFYDDLVADIKPEINRIY